MNALRSLRAGDAWDTLISLCSLRALRTYWPRLPLHSLGAGRTIVAGIALLTCRSCYPLWPGRTGHRRVGASRALQPCRADGAGVALGAGRANGSLCAMENER